jgi:hypothetical protein
VSGADRLIDEQRLARAIDDAQRREGGAHAALAALTAAAVRELEAGTLRALHQLRAEVAGLEHRLEVLHLQLATAARPASAASAADPASGEG